jgi:deoxyhypusine synthase
MLVTLAGAMSTAELGISLAEMIREDKVHAIVCTGANLEEDIFNLVAHDYYERVPHYRHLTAEDEVELVKRHMNRVTDTCIPEMEAMRRIEAVVADEWSCRGASSASSRPVPPVRVPGRSLRNHAVSAMVKDASTIPIPFPFEFRRE